MFWLGTPRPKGFIHLLWSEPMKKDQDQDACRLPCAGRFPWCIWCFLGTTGDLGAKGYGNREGQRQRQTSRSSQINRAASAVSPRGWKGPCTTCHFPTWRSLRLLHSVGEEVGLSPRIPTFCHQREAPAPHGYACSVERVGW